MELANSKLTRQGICTGRARLDVFDGLVAGRCQDRRASDEADEREVGHRWFYWIT
jgi:hypothetical protein